MTNTDYLILVDEQDRSWGKLEKELVHKLGLLHRAFSVFIFTSGGDMLLQQRAEGKYHSAGLWSNACCSHPRFGEETHDAVVRRLREEMGLACATEFEYTFLYKVKFENGLHEHELDHVYTGISDTLPRPDKSEVKSWAYASPGAIREDMRRNPHFYSYWFRLAFERVMAGRTQRRVA